MNVCQFIYCIFVLNTIAIHVRLRQDVLKRWRSRRAQLKSQRASRQTYGTKRPDKPPIVTHRFLKKTNVFQRSPKTLQQILDWAPMNLRMLAAVAPAMYRRLVRAMIPSDPDQPLGIVTDYSGIGGAELSCLEIKAALRELGHSPALYMHRARDRDVTCRRVLLAEVPPDGAAHVFAEIGGEFGASTHHRLQSLSRWIRREIAVLRRCDSMTKAEKTQRANEFGAEFSIRLETYVKTLKFQPRRTQWCFRCNRLCPVACPVGSGLWPKVWLAVAGITCTDFSPFGGRLQLAGLSQISLLLWIYTMLADEPDLIIAECVALFRHETCLKALMQKYELSSLVFSPTLLGVPSHRPRKYMLLRHKTKTVALHDLVDFSRLFYRALIANADVYCIKEQELKAELAELPRKRHMHTEALGDDWRRLLTPSDSRRLDEWLAQAEERKVTVGWCNVSQNVDFMQPCFRSYAPTLMRSSMLYSLAKARVLSLSNHHCQSLPCALCMLAHPSVHSQCKIMLHTDYPHPAIFSILLVNSCCTPTILIQPFSQSCFIQRDNMIIHPNFVSACVRRGCVRHRALASHGHPQLPRERARDYGRGPHAPPHSSPNWQRHACSSDWHISHLCPQRHTIPRHLSCAWVRFSTSLIPPLHSASVHSCTYHA